MRNPTHVLKSLEEQSQSNSEYKFSRIYRNLYNPDFYMEAYRSIAKSQGSMTAGADGLTLDNMSTSGINRIIASLKDHSYQPNPARRVYIAKQNNPAKKRPLGIPSTDDKLVQEVVRMILEAIYEPGFSTNSHGFRSERSCHTALQEVQTLFTGAKWVIEGDIKACFDSFDHHVLIDILRRRKDGALTRAWYGKVRLYVPHDKWVGKLREYKAFKIWKDKTRGEVWKTMHRGALMNRPEMDIVSKFNSEIRGIYNFYRLADNVSVLNKFYFIMEGSMLKTFAAKYNSSVNEIRKTRTVDGVFGVTYHTKAGEKRCEFYHEGFTQNDKPLFGNVDTLPNYLRYEKPNSLAARIKAGKCENCGGRTDEIHMHHVKRLKDLTGKNEFELLMMKMRRKSLALCPDCFEKTGD
jgi:hypothetical protein